MKGPSSTNIAFGISDALIKTGSPNEQNGVRGGAGVVVWSTVVVISAVVAMELGSLRNNDDNDNATNQ